MKVLVTGSSGFIGEQLVRRLVGLGDSVVGCDVKHNSFHHPRFHHTFADFTDLPSLERLFNADFGCCYHGGAVANLNFARLHPDVTMKVNLTGTLNVAQLCRKYKVPMNFISTCCVYGNTLTHPTFEDAVKYPSEIYGMSKLAGEQIVKALCHRYNIVRSSTVYGFTMRKELAISIFLNNARWNKPLPIHGSGKQTRTFIHIDDLTDGLVLLRNQFLNTAFNFAGDETLRILDVAKICVEAGGSKSKLDFVPDRLGQVYREEISIGKAAFTLGWKPKHRLNDFIHEWWLKNES